MSQNFVQERKDDAEQIYEHKQAINNVLLKEDDVAKKMGLSKDALVGFILINDLEKLFVMRCKNLISEELWKEVEPMVYGQLNQDSFFRKNFWDARPPSKLNEISLPPNSESFSLEFREYVKNLTSATNNDPRYGEEKKSCKKSPLDKILSLLHSS
jgi:hypothetical protein